jgi:hypothetical protein
MEYLDILNNEAIDVPTSTGGGYLFRFQAMSTYFPLRLKRSEVIIFFYSRKILSEPMRYNKY